MIDDFAYFTFSLYGYLFTLKPDWIYEYKIVADETGKNFALYRSQWDKMFTLETNTIMISSHGALYDVLKNVIFELREIELKSNIYKLNKSLPKLEYYIPLIAKLENNIVVEGNTTSKAIFGNRAKYDDQKAVEDILKIHGGGFPITDGYNSFLLETYIAEELSI